MEHTCGRGAAGKPRLLDQVRARSRVKRYSLRTVQAYADWIRRFILFHGKRHPQEMGKTEVESFLPSGLQVSTSFTNAQVKRQKCETFLSALNRQLG